MRVARDGARHLLPGGTSEVPRPGRHPRAGLGHRADRLRRAEPGRGGARARGAALRRYSARIRSGWSWQAPSPTRRSSPSSSWYGRSSCGARTGCSGVNRVRGPAPTTPTSPSRLSRSWHSSGWPGPLCNRRRDGGRNAGRRTPDSADPDRRRVLRRSRVWCAAGGPRPIVGVWRARASRGRCGARLVVRVVRR